MENFVHHNPLHALEHLPFDDAVARMREMERYQSPGARAEVLSGVDSRKRVKTALVDLCATFLDRGAAKWAPSFRGDGFLRFFAELEPLGYAPWRAHARETARWARLAAVGASGDPRASAALAASIVHDNLRWFGVPAAERDVAVFSMLNELRGWAGMVYRMETHPSEAPNGALVRIIDFAAVHSILTRSSIETLASDSGLTRRTPVAAWLRSGGAAGGEGAPDPPLGDVRTASSIATVEQSSERREALEKEFEAALLRAVAARSAEAAPGAGPSAAACSPKPRPSLQLFTCIDDREGSFRRHVEAADPGGIETFGVAGFFGLPIRYSSDLDGAGARTLAPEGVAPLLTVVERGADADEAERYRSRRRAEAKALAALESASASPVGSLLAAGFLPLSLLHLGLMGYAPLAKDKLRLAAKRPFLQRPRTTLEVVGAKDGVSVADLVAQTFRTVGLTDRFAPVVLVTGHGATSRNNPYAAAYNCGACCGNDGGPNARLFAQLANDTGVRAALCDNHGIRVPDDTVFVGALHNTTTDVLHYFDADRIPVTHTILWSGVRRTLDAARGRNALERCNRFLLATGVRTPEEALEHVLARSVDPAEVRPELNHATNAAAVVGRRELTKGGSFDRRVFLPSYDPRSDDDAGANLERVLAPALTVGSGINLEYLFSALAVDVHGAGTKSPLNVVAHVGVQQGSTGDLRAGLPSQMTEMHAPIRALFVVDAPPRRVEAVLGRRRDLWRLVHNEWVRLVARDPDTGEHFHARGGRFERFDVNGGVSPPPPPALSAAGLGIGGGGSDGGRDTRGGTTSGGGGTSSGCCSSASSSAVGNPVGNVVGGASTTIGNTSSSGGTGNNDGTTAPPSGSGSTSLPALQPTAPLGLEFLRRNREHGLKVAAFETRVHHAATLGMVAACAVPLALFDGVSMSPIAPVAVLSAGTVSLPVLAFSRRYLHGEHLFPRIALLSVGMLAGFNTVASAPDLETVMAGWGLFGFSSAFLIGAYNDRPTVRKNATLAFAAYRVSDFALLVAQSFNALSVNATSVGAAAAAVSQAASQAVSQPVSQAVSHAASQAASQAAPSAELVAGCLVLAALLKSSQAPLTGLFVRSMEGPTPTSALGYAGLSAHVGAVMLASTMPLWFEHDAARAALAGVGLYTAVSATVVGSIRADRKGALAYATSATIGLIMCVLAAGHAEAALLLSFGHAAFRMPQVLRAPNAPFDAQRLTAMLGRAPWPTVAPDWLYRLAWRLRRIDTDFHPFDVMQRASRLLPVPQDWRPTRAQQVGLAAAGVAVAGAPFTPVSHALEAVVGDLLPTHPAVAVACMAAHFAVSVVVVRLLLSRVLGRHQLRRHRGGGSRPTQAGEGGGGGPGKGAEK